MIKPIYFCLFFISTIAFGQTKSTSNPLVTKDKLKQQHWVDSVYANMSVKERIGQLFMVQIMSKDADQKTEKINALIQDQKIGGVIYSKGTPYKQAQLNNRLQALSKTPLLIGMDAEWGLSMRLDSTYSFPWNMTLGAVDNLSLIKETGQRIGEHCKRLGVHFNFAPVVDINTNPKNPIIGNRSFGENKQKVTEKALAFMHGMQSAGVLANAKHFPGHGDTDADSHKTLPTVQFSSNRIHNVELYPYKTLINEGLSSVMVAHLNIPNLVSNKGIPTSLSEEVVTKLLKDKLQFKGLIFTDALTMKGAANFIKKLDQIKSKTPGGEIDLLAFLAGNDVLLMSENPEKGINKLFEAYQNKIISEERLQHSVKKILQAKYKVGLHHYTPINESNLYNDLNRLEDNLLYEDLAENAITVLKNKSNLLPLKDLETKRIAYVQLGDSKGDFFINQLKKYAKVDVVIADKLDEAILKLKKYNTVVIGFHKSNASPWKAYKFSQKELAWIYEISRTNTVILDVFTRPYALEDLKTIENIEAIVMSYQNSRIFQEKSAQLLFGAIPAKGKLPVSINLNFKENDGLQFASSKKLSYGLPEKVGLNSKKLNKIDSIAQRAIDLQMTPGAQILVARKGKVVYSKNFGYHTYKKKNKVDNNDLYDVASLTKILATLPLVMELEENGIISLNTKLKDILPSYKTSNKKDITIKQMLSHYAQLKPWVPFYAATLDSVTKKPSKDLYRAKSEKGYSIKINNDLFLKDNYPDSIQKTIIESDLLKKLRYRYSDLPYYILKEFIEQHYNKNLNELTTDHFYKSIGANYTTYNPTEQFKLSDIVPTEEDTYYRFDKVHGYVHDMGAAMQNGIGGHAGIFSNANDIAKIMQMYLQLGYYGDKQYIKPETINKFNFCYYCENDNRRGVGFDKPQLHEDGPTCGCLSMKSFGHSGFTGTYAWADPDEEIVYIFLANRTYPVDNTNRLLKENIRTEIQRLIYDAIIED